MATDPTKLAARYAKQLAYNKLYYAKNRDAISAQRATRRKYDPAHAKKLVEAARKYREAHKNDTEYLERKRKASREYHRRKRAAEKAAKAAYAAAMAAPMPAPTSHP